MPRFPWTARRSCTDGDAPLGAGTKTYVIAPGVLTGAHATSPNQVLATLFEPDSDTGRTLTVSVHGGLPSQALTCNVPAQVTAVSLDVVAMS